MTLLNKVMFFVRYQDKTANAYDSNVSLPKISPEELFDTRQENYVFVTLRACVTSSAQGLYIF